MDNVVSFPLRGYFLNEYQQKLRLAIKAISEGMALVGKFQAVIPSGCWKIEGIIKLLGFNVDVFETGDFDPLFESLLKELTATQILAGLDGIQPFKSQMRQLLCSNCERRCKYKV